MFCIQRLDPFHLNQSLSKTLIKLNNRHKFNNLIYIIISIDKWGEHACLIFN